MNQMTSVLFGLALTACEDSEKENTPPTVSITSLSDEDSVLEGRTIQIQGSISDEEDAISSLSVDWYSNSGALCETLTTNPDGTSICETALTLEDTIITLSVTDSNGANTTNSVSIVVTPSSTPEVDWSEPNTASRYHSDVPIQFAAIVSDEEDDASNLMVTWTSNLDEELTELNGNANESGEKYGEAILSSGVHTLEIIVEDTTGKSTLSQKDIVVHPPNQSPICEILTLTDGVGVFGEAMVFDAQVLDEDVIDDVVNIQWASDKDGILDEQTIATDQQISFVTSGLSIDTHEITLSATDGLGASCTQSIYITIGTVPTVNIISPAPNQIYNEGDSITFEGSVLDGEDPSQEITIDWTVNGNSVFAGSADTSGQTAFTTDTLPFGDHTVFLTATDTIGLMGSAQVDFTVNSLPTAPTILLAPSEAFTTSDLIVSIVTDATDPDGDPLQYLYSWSVNGTVIPTLTGDTVPSSDTQQGEVWTVEVQAFDGFAAGPSVSSNLTIQNSTPTFTSAVSISATGTQVGDTWTCNATGSDPDDGSISPTYSWQDTSGNTLGYGETLVLTAQNSEPTEDIHCIASLNDELGLSVSDSSFLTVTNTPPEITSISIDQSDVFTDDIISVSVVYSDADEGNDTSLLLDWYVTDASGVENLVQSGQDDTLDGTLYFDKDNTLRVEATVSDTYTSSNLSSAPLTVLNTPPAITTLSITPDPAYADYDELTCTVVAEDADGDAFTFAFTWSNTSGQSYSSNASSSAISILDASVLTPEEWTCSVSIEDGDDTTINASTITVEPSACDGVSCGPDGTCNNFGSSYTCTCREGFEGNNCELDIDECAVNNGDCTGTRSDCINTMGGHYCIDASTVLAFPEPNNVAAETYYNVAVITVNGRDAFPADTADYLQHPNIPWRQDWYDTDQLGDILFNHPDGLNAFFTEISYGNANFQGVVVDWYDDYDTPKSDNDLFNDRDFYFAESYNQIDPTQFDIFMLVGLVDTGFTQMGWGMGNSVPDEIGGRLNGKGITYLINSSFFNTVGQTRFDGWVLPSVPWVHEIFHTIGIYGHSNTLWCYPSLADYQNATTDEEVHDNATETLSDTCNIKGYGDPFSLMGERLWATHPSVASKLEMDWIPEANKTDLDATGTFNEEVIPLYPHNQTTLTDNVAIQIAVPPFDITTPGGFTLTFDRVTIETRVETGFDTYLSALGSGYRSYSSVANRYLEATYSWNSQYSAGIYDLVYPIDTLGALVYIDSTTDSSEVVYLLDGHPNSEGVLTSQSSPKGHLGNAGKFADAMLNVGDTFASDVLPFTLAVEAGPDNGFNGEVNVRITPIQ